MVSRTVKSARKLIDLIPAHLNEMISHADEHLRESIRDLEDEIRNNGRHLKYHEDRVARYRAKLDDLMTLASSKISIMEVTSEVSVSEQEIP